MALSIPHYINGQACSSREAASHPVFNPASGEEIARVSCAGSQICDEAIAAAKKAYPSWSENPPVKRARILFKYRELLEKYKDDLARMVTREHGKTLDDARGSVARGIEVVELHCGLLNQWQGSFTDEVSSRIDCHTFREPLGVCVGVSPFNFPVMVPVWMMIPAIACGNTFILKPSEQNPSAPLRLIELLSDAGLPPGVANCVQGDKNTVDYLLHHPDIAAFTAVASTPVAEHIYTTATSLGKRSHTFGGAKNHCVVMPDADLNQTAKAIAGAAFGSAGERCMALSVVVAVGDETADAIKKHLQPLIHSIKVDAGDVEGCEMGPLISAAHRSKVLAAVDKGVEEGARLLVDGRQFQHPEHPQGFYMGPCFLDEVQEDMSIYRQEIFGPVLVMMTVQSLDEAIALVNRNPYGNGTAIFTRDGGSAREYSRRVEAGMVGVNIPIPVPPATHPFGGRKRSCFGDTLMHGAESLHFYTRLKTVTTRWPETELSGCAFTMPTHG